ncbi:MAG: ribosome silencing factor [Proteobacteria bacterium]|nr:ribosome silencing factor [Pseudomonadota bacterium]
MQTTQKVVETPAQVELEARLKRVVGVLEDYKAQDVVVIPLAGKTSIADFMVVATGTSSRHVASMGQALEKTLKGDLRGIEGLQEGSWVCADLGDVVAHVFTADKRALYNLEKLWSHVFHSED